MEEKQTITKDLICELLVRTKREGVEKLIAYMKESGFFESPCSTRHHLAKAGGLAEHSLNVYRVARSMKPFISDIPSDSLIICTILHDIGKAGQYGKPGYIPKMLKGRATKANPNPEPTQSTAEPFTSNPELLYIDHEIRSISIISKYIDLTEEEQQAILWHNGLYGPFKYEIPGKESKLYMVLHWADMWASRVIENEGGQKDD